MKQGMKFILEMLQSKREDILTNVLRLILTLIGKSETFTKTLVAEEESRCESARIILKILLGPGLRCTKFTVRVHYFALLVLRQMIKHSAAVKQLILDRENVGSLEAVVSLVQPGQSESEAIQLCVYQFLQHLVAQETDSKRIIGKLMLKKVFWERIKQQLKWQEEDEQALGLFDDEVAEEAFFRLLRCLTRNVIENAVVVKQMIGDMDSLRCGEKTKRTIKSIRELADELI